MRVTAQASGASPAKKKKAQQQGAGAPFKKPRQSGFNVHAKAIGALTTTGPEWKNIDTTAAITPGNAVWSAITGQNLIAQGTGLQQHVGRKIAITKLVMRYSATSAGTSLSHRVLVVYDNHANGALPAITDILTNDAFTGIQNLDNSDRFIVLADFYPFEQAGISTAAGNATGGKIVRKFNPPLLTQFNNTTTATITAIQNGSILLAVCSIGNPAAASFVHFTRIRFVDA